MSLFCLDDVLRIEQEAIEQLGKSFEPTRNYFKEPVAQLLYSAWVSDRSDTRILIYAFPLIQSVMVKHIKLFNGLDPEDVFNSLCVILLEHFPKYKPESGRLYTYLTLILHYKLLDQLRGQKKMKDRQFSLEDWDKPLDTMDSISALIDLKYFLNDLKKQTGPTSNHFLDALLLTLQDASKFHLQDRRMLVQHLCTITKWPETLVIHNLERVIDRYLHSILD